MTTKQTLIARLASAGFFVAAIALAFMWQSAPKPEAQAQSGIVPQYAVPIGLGVGATGFGSSAPGTAGYPLMSNGPSANPTFQALPTPPTLQTLFAYANGVTGQGGGALTSALAGKVIGDTGGSQSNTLPAASSMNNLTLIFQHQQSGTWTLTRAGSDGIFGPNNWNGTTISLPNLGDFVALISDGGNWHIIAGSSAVIVVVASGIVVTPTSAVASGSCGAATAVSAPGITTTDVIDFTFNGDPTGASGWGPPGMLAIIVYPTANNVNFKLCNNTASSITPVAATLNWKVRR